jgi:hypothetical protein
MPSYLSIFLFGCDWSGNGGSRRRKKPSVCNRFVHAAGGIFFAAVLLCYTLSFGVSIQVVDRKETKEAMLFLLVRRRVLDALCSANVLISGILIVVLLSVLFFGTFLEEDHPKGSRELRWKFGYQILISTLTQGGKEVAGGGKDTNKETEENQNTNGTTGGEGIPQKKKEEEEEEKTYHCIVGNGSKQEILELDSRNTKGTKVYGIKKLCKRHAQYTNTYVTEKSTPKEEANERFKLMAEYIGGRLHCCKFYYELHASKLKQLRYYLSNIELWVFFALCFTSLMVFIHSVLALGTMSYTNAMTDYVERNWENPKVHYQKQYFEEVGKNLSAGEAIPMLRGAMANVSQFYTVSMALFSFATFNVYKYFQKENGFLGGFILNMAFLILVQGWCLGSAAYVSGERDGSGHIISELLIAGFCGFVPGLAFHCIKVYQHKGPCATVWDYLYPSLSLFIVAVGLFNLANEGPAGLSLACSMYAIFPAIHLVNYAVPKILDLKCCGSKEYTAQEKSKALFAVIGTGYLVALICFAVLIASRRKLQYVSPFMILLGCSFVLLAIIVFKRVESATLTQADTRAIAWGVTLLSRFALGMSVVMTLFFQYCRTSIQYQVEGISEVAYAKLVRDTKWVYRAKEDFEHALKSDFDFFFWLSLESCVLILCAGVTSLHWRDSVQDITMYEGL